jgi:hypothetical protein
MALSDSQLEFWKKKTEQLVELMPELTANQVAKGISARMPVCSTSRLQADRLTLHAAQKCIEVKSQNSLFGNAMNKFGSRSEAMDYIMGKE